MEAVSGHLAAALQAWSGGGQIFTLFPLFSLTKVISIILFQYHSPKLLYKHWVDAEALLKEVVKGEKIQGKEMLK